MSCTEHWKGKLKSTGKALDEYMVDIEIEDYWDDKQEYFKCELDDKAVLIDGVVFEISKEEVDLDEYIANAKKRHDGTIDFEVRFYNGGCSFGEALGEALDGETLRIK